MESSKQNSPSCFFPTDIVQGGDPCGPQQTIRIRFAHCPYQRPDFRELDNREIPCGVASCAPLVQHELLKAVRERMPSVYNHAAREIGLTVSRTQELIERRVEIISSARAIRLARVIALEPNSHAVFGEAGQKLFDQMRRDFPLIARASIRTLPAPLRIRLAMTWTQRRPRLRRQPQQDSDRPRPA